MRKMNRLVFPVLMILVLLFVSSCSNDSSNADSDSDLPELSIEGISWKTTAEDVVSMFGEPDEKKQEIVYSKDFDLYKYNNINLFRLGPLTMRVYFNSKDKDIGQIHYFRYDKPGEGENRRYQRTLTELYGEPSETCWVLNNNVYAMQWNNAARDTIIYYEYCVDSSVTLIFHNKKYAKGLNPIQYTKKR